MQPDTSNSAPSEGISRLETGRPRISIWRSAGRLSPVAVWLVWLVHLAAAMWFVAHYGSDLPVCDEWTWVPFFTGAEPFSLAGLWAQANEHRLPLPKLVFHILFQLTNGDIRVFMFVTVGTLATAAALMILAARKMRGKTVLTDCVFPLILLHWGHADNLLMATQLHFVLPAAILGCFLAYLSSTTRPGTPGVYLPLGAAILALPLCSGNGVGLVPPLGCWLLLAAVFRWRQKDTSAHRDASAMAAIAVMAGVLTTLYFVGYQRPLYHPPSPGVGDSLRVAGQFLTMSIGPRGQLWWPASLGAVLTIGLLVVSFSSHAYCFNPEERVRAAGLLAGLAALLIHAGGVGWARAALSPEAGFAPRYVVLATPLLVLGYFCAECYGPRRLAGLAKVLLMVFFVAMLRYHVAYGKNVGGYQMRVHQAFTRDLRADVSVEELATRHYAKLAYDRATFVRGLRMLRDTKTGPFRAGRE